MCGIMGAVARRNITSVLLDGLKRLEYRGYDSAGIALMNGDKTIYRERTSGKVADLVCALQGNPMQGHIGIAHTRWATHGKPTVSNAHPHLSSDAIAVVHNGIIENFESLRQELAAAGYAFLSETDTEVVAHLMHYHHQSSDSFLDAVRTTTARLQGAFALGLMTRDASDQLVAVRQGSPLVIGVGTDENFIASDPLALLSVTQQFIYLEEGDIAFINPTQILIYNTDNEPVERPVQPLEANQDPVDKAGYRHFMLKEIFEQPQAIAATLQGRLSPQGVFVEAFGPQAAALFPRVKQVQIVACGTSYHAGCVARDWIESCVGIPCYVDIASEWRYRKNVVQPATLFVAISQSGETADTLACVRVAKTQHYLGVLGICNVPHSALVRESDVVFMTQAGMEIGVASTKAFTTQLTALLMLTSALCRVQLPAMDQGFLVDALTALPTLLKATLALDQRIKALAQHFQDKQHALFLGRGSQFPVALEGALKLKEISYIHAEAYPAGELKHGPLALVDKDMPVIAVAPNDALLEKLKSNLQEVRARGGELFVFSDASPRFENQDGVTHIDMPAVPTIIAPILYTVPLQLLSYHVAVLKGTDIDQPRNLAKSVTVE